MPFPYNKGGLLQLLQALNDRGEFIIPSTLTDLELKALRKQSFYCPECKEKVIIRAGPQVRAHCAHLPESSCSLNYGGESDYHKQAKVLLYQLLKNQFYPHVYLEKYLPNINQRPDILIKTKKR